MGPLMRPPARWKLAAAVTAALCLSSGCDQSAELDGPAETSPGLSVTVGALKSSCGASDANPLQVVEKFQICGQAPIRLADGGTAVRKLFDRTVGVGPSVGIGDVRVNDLYEVTAVGLVGGKPRYFGRAKNVSVRVDAATELSMTLAPFNDIACIDAKPAGNPNHRLWPASVRLADGRVFVSGGFGGITSAGGKTELTNASDKTFFFDPKDGTITLGPTLAEGRAAHAAIYVPTEKKVVLIGGAARMPFSDTPDRLGLQYDSQTGINTIEVIDVSTKVATVVASGVKMNLKRAFPRVALVGSGEVIITGGGAWPEADADYKTSEIFDARINELTSALTVTDFAPRSGHTLTFVKNETVQNSTVEIFLAWGGTTTDSKAAFLVNTRGQQQAQPTFAPATFTADSAPLDRTWFHSVTALSDDRFLVLGGVSNSGTKLDKLDASFAWLATYGRDENQRTIKVEKLSGFPNGRWAHTATSHDGSVATIIGGFESLTGDGTGSIVYFDGVKKAFSTSPQPPSFAPRGGHSATLLLDDSIFLAGGVQTTADIGLPEVMLTDVYVPNNVSFCTAPVPAEGEEL